MTTNRMGLEQALSDERLEDLAKGQYFFARGAYEEAQAMARELLAYRKASEQADGDDNFYSWFSREWEQYYQPNQYTTSAKQHLGAIAESAWFACRAAMLKSVTNEP